jgi:hypothetical protein
MDDYLTTKIENRLLSERQENLAKMDEKLAI